MSVFSRQTHNVHGSISAQHTILSNLIQNRKKTVFLYKMETNQGFQIKDCTCNLPIRVSQVAHIYYFKEKSIHVWYNKN